MTEPTKKADVIERLLESFAGRTTAIKSNHCVPPPIGCGLPITGFDDELSAKEYRISGLCQSCQNEIFCDRRVVDLSRRARVSAEWGGYPLTWGDEG